MGFDTFLVVLTTQAPVFFSGQQLQGFVKILASSDVSCRDITVMMRGKGKVEWTERRNKRSVTYSSKEEYGKQSIVIWRGNETHNTFRSGSYTFPFMFVLPQDIPSSFETDEARVHYEIKATANRPFNFDEEDKVYFNVHHPYDLNEDPNSTRPLLLEKEGEPCCSSGAISFELTTNRRGYVPGEKMLLNGRIFNNSSASIKYTEAKIVQTMLLHASYKTKTTLTTVQRVYRPGISPGREDVWSSIPLTIPAVCPSVFRFCNIIDINYALQFVAKVSRKRSVTANSTLIIGSVALQVGRPSHSPSYQPGIDNRMNQPSMAAFPMPSAPMEPYNALNDAPPPYPESLPPPSYEACKNLAALSEHQASNAGSDDDEGGFLTRNEEKTGYNRFQ